LEALLSPSPIIEAIECAEFIWERGWGEGRHGLAKARARYAGAALSPSPLPQVGEGFKPIIPKSLANPNGYAAPEFSGDA